MFQLLSSKRSADGLSRSELRAAARELYQQINFIRDIDASSRAIADRLRAIENGGLDESFAQVDSELLDVADDVAEGCAKSLDICRHTQELLHASISAFDKIHVAIGALVESTCRVRDVSESIDKFARQTGLIAVNARVQAAHAGEHGRGFSVVAEEVAHLASQIQSQSDSIRDAIETILVNSENTATLVNAEVDRNHVQVDAASQLLDVNQTLEAKGRRLPEMVARLDQFLEPLEQARAATNHNRMIHVSVENVTRNLQSLHTALTVRTGPHSSGAIVSGSYEEFVDRFSEAMTRGEDAPVEAMLDRLMKQDTGAVEALGAVGKAVQAANMRQSHTHVSVGDYYVNFLLVERAFRHLDSKLPKTATSDMTVVLGNARGDYHSLGREMVGMFLRAAGVHVVDVGFSAEPAAFVAAVRQSGARVVGVSSLLIESAKEIIRVREGLDRAGLRHVKIVAGGACFTVDRELYREVKADYVATAASDLVSIVESIYEHNPLQSEAAR